MKKFLKCLKGYISTRRKYIYIEIAGNHKVSSFYVYKLAHGYKAQTATDDQILKELQQEGIIKGIKY